MEKPGEIGSGRIRVDLDGIGLTIHVHQPTAGQNGFLILFHGNSGNANALRDFALPLSRLSGLTVVAPLFDKRRFPPNAYQRGNITDRRKQPNPSGAWTTRLVPLLVQHLQGPRDLPYWLWGFSAGGQFLSRVAAFQDLPSPPQRLVIASPSSHVLPLIDPAPAGEAAPYGLGGVFPIDDQHRHLCRYLGRPVTLCVGADDSEATDPALARSRAAMRQGGDRLTRAAKTFDLGAMAALRHRCAFGWQFKIVPGVGHSARELLEPARALSILDLANHAPHR